MRSGTRNNQGPGRRRSRRATAATLLLTLGLAALGGAPAQAEPGPAAKQLVYQGHRFTVPSSWKVVDLAKNPTACVRFDQHAVYLGQPAADQDCPSHAVGRTEALLVEPAANPADRRGTVARPEEREYRAKSADVSITATYDTNPALVRSILTGADVPTAAPRVQESQESQESPGLLAAEATAAALPATATNYTGKGFDTCAAPSSGAMSSWQASSPYSAVGIYIGGSQRACSQPNLTASWVQQQADDGWRFIPIYVGTQASGITSPAGQGISAANDAISNATALGFGPGSTLYYDMEAYSSSYTSKVLTFESAWTEQLHARGYHSGIYSSSSSGIKDLVDNYSGYTMPDVIYDALWNGVADTADPVVPSSRWSNHQRIHQYSGGHSETWGGTTINIDQDYLDVQISTDTATPHGRVWDRSRPDGGPWDSSATLIDEGGAVNAVAAAGLPNGTTHVQALVNGEIWDRARSATGAWGASSMIDGQGAITDVATAALPDGTLHVQAVVNGEIWDRTRAANGTWSNSTKIDAGGAVTDVASAALPDGTLHVQALVNGEIWDRTRSATGTWGASSMIDGNGGIKDLASAALPDGTLHVQALVNGEVWDRTRSEGGAWGNSTKIDAGGAVTQISSAGLPNGDLHVEAVVNGDVWDRVRKGTTGNWSVSSLVDNNGAIFSTYATATPNGTLHVGTNA